MNFKLDYRLVIIMLYPMHSFSEFFGRFFFFTVGVMRHPFKFPNLIKIQNLQHDFYEISMSSDIGFNGSCDHFSQRCYPCVI